ncbi:MAG: sulfite exporter TauE/SafE family protein [Chloroflexi bacterium]|nr:sulfite exporter TauE/SafE family protein [Chloroflexota bacterium]
MLSYHPTTLLLTVSMDWNMAVDPITLIPAAFIVLAAGVIKGTSAFGFGLVSAPLLLLLWEPRSMVAIVLPLVLVLDTLIILQGRRFVNVRRILPMMAAGAVGAPLGTYILIEAPPALLEMAIALSIVGFAGVLLRGYTLTIRRETIAGSIAGFLSGLMATTSAVSGPPMTLLLLNQRWERDIFRTSISSCLVPINAIGLLSLALSGVVTSKTLLVDLVFLPLVLLAYVGALRLLPHLHGEVFRRLAALLVMAAGIMAIIGRVVELF